MKILLFGDFSFLHLTLKKGLEEMGHEVLFVSDGEGRRNTKRDIDVARDLKYGKFGGLKVLWTLLRNASRLCGHDMVVLHWYQAVPLRGWLNVILLRYLKKYNRSMLLGCYFDDPQVVGMQLKGVPRYSEMYWNGKPQNLEKHGIRLKQLIPECVSSWRKAVSMADVIIPCLYEYWAAYAVEPLLRRKLRYIPLPMVIPHDVEIKGRRAKINVLVGVQSKREYVKGAREIAKMVEEVARRNPGRIDIRYVEDVPYAEYCAMLAEADVQVDQLYSFTPSMNSLAAMARGTVVIGGGEEEFYDFIGEKELRPIINVSPEKSFEDNVKAIETAIVPEGSVERLSRQGIEFVRKYHDYRKVAAMYAELYNKLIHNS